MSFQPTPKQALVIWSLLITKDEPAMSKVKPELSPAERGPLIESGLIILEKRGIIQEKRGKSKRIVSNHIVLTDKAWEWASEHFEVELSKSPSAAPVLEGLLKIAGRYLQAHKIPISEFLKPRVDAASTVRDIEPMIRNAYLLLSGGEFNRRVRLCELRQFIDDCSRSEMDEALIRMGRAEKLTLMRLDDPQEIKLEDEQAALISGGQKNHIIYMREW